MNSSGNKDIPSRGRRLFGNGCLVIGAACLAFAVFLYVDISHVSASPDAGMGAALGAALLLAVLAIGLPVTLVGLYFAIPQWRVRRLPERPGDNSVELSAPTPSSPESEPVAALRVQSPPFGVRHLLGWGFCTVLYALAGKGIMAASGLPTLELNMVFWAINCMTGGLALGALLLVGCRRLRGTPFPGFPGETYLCILSLRSVFLALLYPLAVRFGFAVPFKGMLYLCMAALAFVAADSVRVRRWSVFFFAVVAWCIFLALSSIVGFGSEIVVEGCMFASVLVVCAIDARQKEKYPWTHWLGDSLGRGCFRDTLGRSAHLQAVLVKSQASKTASSDEVPRLAFSELRRSFRPAALA